MLVECPIKSLKRAIKFQLKKYGIGKKRLTQFLISINGYRIRGYVDRGISRQFRFLIWISYIYQLVHYVGGDCMH